MVMGLFDRTNTYGLRGLKLQVAITLCAVTGFSLFGYDQGLMSSIITSPQFNKMFPSTLQFDDNEVCASYPDCPILRPGDNHYHTNYEATVTQGAVTSSYEVGCFFGAVFALFMGDYLGRRPIIQFGSLWMIIGTVISVSAFEEFGKWGLGQFVIGRVISGIGNGMNTATIPVWQSEMSKAEYRGMLVSFEGSVIAVGTMLAYWITFGTTYAHGSIESLTWRFPIALQIVFAIFILIMIWGLPESPRWLLGKRRTEQARFVLKALAGKKADDETINEEIRILEEAIDASTNKNGFREVFTNGKEQNFRRMLLGASGQFFQQFTGCNAAIYYSTVLFETMQQGRRMSLIMGGIFASVYALFTLPAFFLVERVGRRNLYLIGAIGQGCAFFITMGCLAAVDARADPMDNQSKQDRKGAVVGLYIFIVFFAFTILQLPWIYPPEINPSSTRTAAVSLSTCSNWASNFAVVMFTPIFINSSEWGCYLFFALMNFIWVPIIFFFYPETAGRTLEEMDVIFAKAHVEGRPVWRVAATLPKLTAEETEQESIKLGLYGNRNPEKTGVNAESPAQLAPDEHNEATAEA